MSVEQLQIAPKPENPTILRCDILVRALAAKRKEPEFVTTRALRNFTVACTLGMSLCGGFARATDGTRDFARYQVILDRAPFGAMAGTAAEVQQPAFDTVHFHRHGPRGR